MDLYTVTGTYFDFKRMLVAGKPVKGGVDHGRAIPLDTTLDALGVKPPERANAYPSKRQIKVYRVDVSTQFKAYDEALFEQVRKATETQKRMRYMVRVPGWVVAKSKAEVTRLVLPTYLHGTNQAVSEIADDIAPTDWRYWLAVDNPDSVIITADGTEFGEPLIIPLAEFSAPPREE